jgi:hypothetical protein
MITTAKAKAKAMTHLQYRLRLQMSITIVFLIVMWLLYWPLGTMLSDCFGGNLQFFIISKKVFPWQAVPV